MRSATKRRHCVDELVGIAKLVRTETTVSAAIKIQDAHYTGGFAAAAAVTASPPVE